MSQRVIKCICQVCTCGKHRCLPPPRRTPRYDPADIQSNYQRNYPSYPGHQPPKAFRSDDKFVSAGKFEGQSQSHRDYQAWPVETNTTSYVPPFDRSTHKTPIPFVGSTTNRDEYNWKSPSTDRAKPRDYSSIKVGVNLDGSRSQFSASTTNRDEYQKHDLSLLRSSLLSSPSKSAHRYDVRPKLPFHGSSTQRTAYPPHPIDQNVGRRVPRDQRFQPTNARFEGETTNASTYKEWDLSGRDRISLSFPAATVSNTLKPLPFHGSSTSHDAYQHTPAACPASQMLANPQHQCSHTTNEPDDRTFQTTSADNYRPLEIEICPASRTPFHYYTGDHALYERTSRGWMPLSHPPTPSASVSAASLPHSFTNTHLNTQSSPDPGASSASPSAASPFLQYNSTPRISSSDGALRKERPVMGF